MVIRFLGTPVRFTLWSLVLVYLVGSFGWDVAPRASEMETKVLYAAAFVVSFFVSLLLHERAHVFVASHFGIGCSGIEVFLLGGAAQLHSTGNKPREAFLIAVVGPVTSVAIGLVLSGAGWLMEAGARGLVADLVTYFAFWNIAIGIFNLLPVFPLDGGRIAHSLLWIGTRNEYRGRLYAVRLGRVCIIIASVLLVYGFMADAIPLFTLLWFGFIGFFLWTAQKAELRSQ